MAKNGRSAGMFEIMSPVFRDGQAIPNQYTAKGHNVNPPLNIFNPPEETQSLTLIMHDPDAPGGDFLHWLVWDIPPSTECISVNSVPVGAVQGLNGMGEASYMGPAPPAGSGKHRYVFDFYALDTTLNLPAGATINDVIKAQKGRLLDKAAITGTFSVD